MTESKPPNQPSDGEWAEKAAAQLRDAEQHLPSDVQLQLQSARRAAVEAAEQPERRAAKPWLTLGAGGLLAAAATVLVLLSSPEMMEMPDLDEQELAAAQEVELLEDLEFVAWMLAMEETDENPNQG